MTKSELMKEAILKKYKSVRSFSIYMKVPYSTLATALDRGIEGMAYGTVIRICEELEINPIDFSPLGQDNEQAERYLEHKLTKEYLALNDMGRKRILETLEDYGQIPKYVKQ